MRCWPNWCRQIWWPDAGWTGPTLLAWHDHLALSLRRSPHTVRAYHRTAQRLLDALPPEQDWASLARLDATRLRQHLAERRADGLVNTSAARELSALKAFLAFARAQAGLPDAAAPRLRGPRVKKACPARCRPTMQSRLPRWFPTRRPRGSRRAIARCCCCSMAQACALPRRWPCPPACCRWARH
jgi:site-specific recombinase XerC